MYKYLKYLPENYFKAHGKASLLIFLHGAPQRGDDIEILKESALPNELEKGLKLPFVVVVPHCPRDESWDSQKLYDFYNHIVDEFKIDKDRVYITGFSMGGFGTLKFARDYPGLFAAAAPVCSGGSRFFAEELASVPLWFFHGENDKIIEIEKTAELVDELKKNNAEVKFTRYPDLAHDVWTSTYRNRELYDWFLEHKI